MCLVELLLWRSNRKPNRSVSCIKRMGSKRRDLGGLIFIDLRDRTGIVQVVFNPDLSKEALETAESIRNEYVLDIKGTVVAREEATINPNLKRAKLKFKSKRSPF